MTLVAEKQGYERIIEEKSVTFSAAAELLPEPVRCHVRLLYAYFRTVDDLVDGSRPDGHDWLHLIERSIMSVEGSVAAERERTASAIAPPAPWDDPLMYQEIGVSSFVPRPEPDSSGGTHRPVQSLDIEHLVHEVRTVAGRYGIPTTLLLEVVEGARYDLEMSTVPTFEELSWYSDRVAGSVGAALCHVFGAATQPAVSHARTLGIAMQLTNILRDVADDLNRGRIYLPLEDLARFGLSPSDLAIGAEAAGHASRDPNGSRDRPAAMPESSHPLRQDRNEFDDRWRRLMRFEISRARRLYRSATPGIALLPPLFRPSVLAASQGYARILGRIEAWRYDVFSMAQAARR